MTNQPEALRLADTPFALRDGRWNFDADDELRRLHNENQAAHAVGIQQEREMMALEAEVERLRAELARLTTLRPASEPRPAKVLLWDKHGEFAGNHVQQARMPDSWFWTPIPTPEEADK
jgi:uncharacterized small protein (DUF1192 family)